MSGLVKTCAFVSVFIVFIAFFMRNNFDDELRSKLNIILESLERVEKEHSVISKKVAIGYGACLDLFVDGNVLLPYNDLGSNPEHFTDISSNKELSKTYAYFYRHGAAAERYVSNSSLFDELVNRAFATAGSHSGLGGNAPVMASRFAHEGCKVLLAAKMSPELQKFLPRGVTVVGGETSKDDVHLILEYKAEERWGPHVAPRANRFIIHNDRNNPTVSSAEEFEKALAGFRPNLLVVGGLQMMDNFPFAPGVRKARLHKVREQMSSQPASTKVHFEMASFAESEMLVELTQNVIPFADSLGMNEQELANLHSTLVYGNVSLVADAIPRVAVVLDQMRHVFRLVRERSGTVPGGRLLTRLHVHTLAYQAIMTSASSPWRNSMAAAAKASLTANRHVCGSKQVDVDKATLIMDESFSTSVARGSQRVPLELDHPVSCWSEGEVQICVAPVLVCTRAHQTAGGGDNISSAGLVLQL
ncbi:ADP-dependent glucokinase [Bacillus rossius redtenbacheri]|uniref:ADP-dependent glucokinase n=1 Tax=Bacillus rossius redtenbacheri TaxID=93214 RepID=UPI002FDF0688